MQHQIRLATPQDSTAILAVYAYYVQHTPASFELVVPHAQEFQKRVERICAQYPYLVYLVNNQIVGYAYAYEFAQRAAYSYDVEVSVYVHANYHGHGVAKRLYHCLLSILKELGYYNAYAGITVPNEKSQRFHEKFGFALVGTYHKTGYKLGSWHDVIHMEKALQPQYGAPGPIKSIGGLPRAWLDELFTSAVTL